jgi:hypothetical protein
MKAETIREWLKTDRFFPLREEFGETNPRQVARLPELIHGSRLWATRVE